MQIAMGHNPEFLNQKLWVAIRASAMEVKQRGGYGRRRVIITASKSKNPGRTQNPEPRTLCMMQPPIPSKQACPDRFPPFPTRKSVFRSLKLRWLRLHHHHTPTYIPYMKKCTSAQWQNLTQERTVNFIRCFWSVWRLISDCLLLYMCTNWYLHAMMKQSLPAGTSSMPFLQPACNHHLCTEASQCSYHHIFFIFFPGFWIGKTVVVSNL